MRWRMNVVAQHPFRTPCLPATCATLDLSQSCACRSVRVRACIGVHKTDDRPRLLCQLCQRRRCTSSMASQKGPAYIKCRKCAGAC